MSTKPGTLKIDVRMVFGRVLYYADCPLSKLLVELSGKKTFSGTELKKLSDFGFDIQYRKWSYTTEETK
jgi:hypothetical protein